MKEIEVEIDGLRRMTVPELLKRYEDLFGKPARVKNREHLWKRCAWKVQEARFGGLSKIAKDKLEELMAEIELPLSEEQRTVSGTLKKPPKPGDPSVGTVLTREWHGKRLEAKVVEGGFEHEGVVYKTLSEAAKAITGAHWNGRLFFGLTERKKAK
jgi:hypothetical protein